MAGLRRLDAGHGYTADGGRSFPLRGRGVGLMPSLGEVLEAGPEGHLLINVTCDDPRRGEALAGLPGRPPPERRAGLMARGGERPMEAFRTRLPRPAHDLAGGSRGLPGALPGDGLDPGG